MINPNQINYQWIVIAAVALSGCGKASPSAISMNDSALSPGTVISLDFPPDPLVTRLVIAKTTEELALANKAFRDHDHDRLTSLEESNRINLAIPGTRGKVLGIAENAVQIIPISRDKTIGWVGYVDKSLCRATDQSLTEEESERAEFAWKGDAITLLTELPCVIAKEESDLEIVDDNLRRRDGLETVEALCKNGLGKRIDTFPVHGEMVDLNIGKKIAHVSIPGLTGFVSEYRITKGKLAPRQPSRK